MMYSLYKAQLICMSFNLIQIFGDIHRKNTLVIAPLIINFNILYIMYYCVSDTMYIVIFVVFVSCSGLVGVNIEISVVNSILR